jgi:Mg2+ and Co2+ transporter CorA
VSVILLPGTLLAGVMGMNFRVGLFDVTWLFWVVVALIGAVAPVAHWFARARRWF